MDQSQNTNSGETVASVVNTNNEVASNQSAVGGVSYAGFWVRAAALILDSLIMGAVTFFIGFIFGVASGISKSAPLSALMGNLASLIGVVVSLSYYVLMTWKRGATLGKQVLGLRVIRGNGDNISLGRAALREIIGRFVSGITLCIGYVIAVFSDKKRALHDMIADTVVVDLHPENKKTGWRVSAMIVVVLIPIIWVAFFALLLSYIQAPFLDGTDSSKIRVSEKDMEVADYLEQTMGNARFYRLDSKDGTFKGFSPDDNLDLDGNILVNAECSGEPYVNISEDGKEIAAFAKSCDDPTKYICYDEGIEMKIDNDSNLVSEEVAESGATNCSEGKQTSKK